MIEDENQDKQVSVSSIFEQYPMLFEEEIVYDDKEGELLTYYLEKRFNQGRDSFRIVLTPSGPIIVGSILRNVWDITTQRDEGCEDYINEKNVNKNNKDLILLDKLRKVLEEQFPSNNEEKEVFFTFSGSLYCIIPICLQKGSDMEQLFDLLENRKRKSLQQGH